MSMTSNAKKYLAGLPAEAQSYIKAQNYGKELSSGEAKRFYEQYSTEGEKYAYVSLNYDI